MKERLVTAWTAALRGAQSWRAGRDPTPVLESLSWSLVLSVTGALDGVPLRTRQRLVVTGRRALAQVDASNSESDDEHDADDLLVIANVARAGLDALAGGPPEKSERLRIHPSPAEIVRLLSGGLDAFAAGACAHHVTRCARCAADLRAAASVSATSFVADPPLRVAAADPVSVRPPSAGRTVASLRDPDVEAVLFEATTSEPRTLAVYARDSVPVRLVGTGVTTTETLAGYWLGRIGDDVARLDATLHVGETVRGWRIALRRTRRR